MVTRTEGRDIYWLREAQRVHGKPPLPVFLTRLEDDQAGRQWIHPPSTVLAWHIVRKSGRLSSLGDCEQLYNRVLSLALDRFILLLLACPELTSVFTPRKGRHCFLPTNKQASKQTKTKQNKTKQNKKPIGNT